MDKKNTVIGLLLLMAAFTLMVFQNQNRPVVEPPERPVVTDRADESPRQPLPPGSLPTTPRALPETLSPDLEIEEQLTTLENDYFRVEFTNLGGAVKRVFLKEYALTKGSEERYVLNDPGHLPALGLVDFPGADSSTGYRLVSQSATEVVFAAVVGDFLEVERRYSIQMNVGRRDPSAYLIQHTSSFRNLTGQALLLEEFGVHLGTAVPTGRQMIGMEHLNFNYYDGNRFRHLAPRKFQGGGFLSWIGMASGEAKPFIRETIPLEWASIKNQFFANIFTPEQQAVGFIAYPVDLPEEQDNKSPLKGMSGNVRFDLRGVPAQDALEVSGSFYAGPKEFRRLEAMGNEQDRVMQFGWPIIAFISKLLLSMMIGIEGWVMNFGLAIILVTVIIKTILWPLTAKAARSSKAMAKIQEPMKALREKFKDDPKKMQMETMKLFRENKVNPVGGCLPMLVQIPIFFALFRMIMSASELRFSEFLWVADLSAPDTIGYVFGLPINILPIFMGISMYYQMRMMPMAMDSTQQKIFRLMPFIFFIFCYNFSSGLVLYWTVQNLLTITQQYLTNRKNDDISPTTTLTADGSVPAASPYIKKGKGKSAKAKAAKDKKK
jgi:YidC/Oxa1 family membrane protein insertase